MKRVVKMGLVAGRHNIPEVEGYFFQNDIENPFDFQRMERIVDFKLTEVGYFNELHLYVTGLTTALIAVLNYVRNCKVVLYHFDRETGTYIPQEFKLTEEVSRLEDLTYGM